MRLKGFRGGVAMDRPWTVAPWGGEVLEAPPQLRVIGR
jgi:hypothetical protein